MKRPVPKCLVLLMGHAALAGCMVGPDYHAPKIATPATFAPLSSQDAPLSLPQAGEADLSRWWTTFHDPELESLIDRALKANLDLLAAASRVREARTQEVVAGAAGLPSVSASGNAAHLHSGRNIFSQLGSGAASGAPASGASPSSGGTDIQLYSLGFDATWELDIFGGVRRSVQAAQAGTEAARWQMRDGQVTLTAEIATDYFNLREAQARLAILQGELDSQHQTMALVADRARTGFVTELDVNQQSALAASTESQIPSLQSQVRLMEHALSVLLAVAPDSLNGELEKPVPATALPASLPVGLPSDLLRRRPDVRQAERKLAQATAQVGVAVADLYPKFNLIGALNLSGNSVSSLFNSSSLGELGLGMITWPIFKGGQIHANIRARQEETQQAYYAYQKTVLAAVGDAEDALVRYAGEQRRTLALERAVARDASSTTIAGQQYRVGLTNYINVLTAENNDLQARDQLAQSRATLAADLASLYKALGGGWEQDGTP